MNGALRGDDSARVSTPDELLPGSRRSPTGGRGASARRSTTSWAISTSSAPCPRRPRPGTSQGAGDRLARPGRACRGRADEGGRHPASRGPRDRGCGSRSPTSRPGRGVSPPRSAGGWHAGARSAEHGSRRGQAGRDVRRQRGGLRAALGPGPAPARPGPAADDPDPRRDERRVVVDVAAGTGALLGELRAAAGPAASVVALDQASRMLRRITHPLPRAQSDAVALPLRDESVDVLVQAFVLFLLPDAVRGVREAARVLRPGGRLVATWGEQRPALATRWSGRRSPRPPHPSPRASSGPTSRRAARKPSSTCSAARSDRRAHPVAASLDARFDASAFLEMRTRCGVSGWRFGQARAGGPGPRGARPGDPAGRAGGGRPRGPVRGAADPARRP